MSKQEPLDELYFKWLYSQVGSVKQRSRAESYWTLLKQLYTKEFAWHVPNDDNRAVDGRNLRYEFLEFERLSADDPSWMDLECSMLEMLIGLSRRLSFENDGEPRDAFWHLLSNVNLHRFNDATQYKSEIVDVVLDRIIHRTYSYDGVGGLFPLKQAVKDQRQVELWYQLCTYVMEEC